jgi:hypothetical protein
MSDAARADLFLLKPWFADPAFPDDVFFDRYSALLEGVLVAFPELASRIQVHRVAFERPRREVIDLAGAACQSLPRLVLPPGVGTPHATDEHEGRRSVAGASAIVAVLVELYDIPPPHP